MEEHRTVRSVIRCVETEGGMLAVRTYGTGSKAMVATHGVGGFGFDWVRTAACLGDGWSVNALDFRGFGLSTADPSHDYTPARFASDVNVVRGALKLSNILLVGHSYGVRPAWLAASSEPDGILGVVAVDAGPEQGPGMTAVKERVASWPTEFRSPEEAAQQYRELYAQEGEEHFRQRMDEYLVRLPTGGCRLARDPWWKETWAPSQGGVPPAWEEWRAVPAPTLVVRGGNSPMLTRETGHRMVSENANASLVEIPGVGHNIPLEAPAELCSHIREFYERCGGLGRDG